MEKINQSFFWRKVEKLKFVLLSKWLLDSHRERTQKYITEESLVKKLSYFSHRNMLVNLFLFCFLLNWFFSHIIRIPAIAIAIYIVVVIVAIVIILLFIIRMIIAVVIFACSEWLLKILGICGCIQTRFLWRRNWRLRRFFSLLSSKRIINTWWMDIRIRLRVLAS